MSKQFESRQKDGQANSIEAISKSQRKRQSTELQQLGAELARLSSQQLDALPLPVELRDALAVAQSIRPHGALKRQGKYIGGILRTMDVESIREDLARLRFQSSHAVRRHHKIEKWRDRLLAEGDDAIGPLLAEIPSVDRQQIRQIVRNAHQEQLQGKPPRASRLLYRFLRDVLE